MVFGPVSRRGSWIGLKRKIITLFAPILSLNLPPRYEPANEPNPNPLAIKPAFVNEKSKTVVR